MNKHAVVLLISIILGLVEAGLAVPLILRRIKPNSMYGLPGARAYDSSRVWYRANSYFGKLLVGAGIASAIATALFWASKPHMATRFLGAIELGILLVPFAVALVLARLSLRKY